MIRTVTAIPILLFGAACTVSTAVGNLMAGVVMLTALVEIVRQRGAGVTWPPRGVMLALAALLATHALATALQFTGDLVSFDFDVAWRLQIWGTD